MTKPQNIFQINWPGTWPLTSTDGAVVVIVEHFIIYGTEADYITAFYLLISSQNFSRFMPLLLLLFVDTL